MNQTGIVTLFRVIYELLSWCPYMIPSFPPDSILNLCVVPFPSGRVRDGGQNGMGVWGKGQLEHVSDGELLNSTLWITFWRDYKMIFSIGSLAHARALFRV